MFYGGMGVVEDSNLIEQYRFPRSKRKRIRKKWSKDKEGNFEPSTKVYYVAGRMLCHPIVAQALREP